MLGNRIAVLSKGGAPRAVRHAEPGAGPAGHRRSSPTSSGPTAACGGSRSCRSTPSRSSIRPRSRRTSACSRPAPPRPGRTAAGPWWSTRRPPARAGSTSSPSRTGRVEENLVPFEVQVPLGHVVAGGLRRNAPARRPLDPGRRRRAATSACSRRTACTPPCAARWGANPSSPDRSPKAGGEHVHGLDEVDDVIPVFHDTGRRCRRSPCGR